MHDDAWKIRVLSYSYAGKYTDLLDKKKAMLQTNPWGYYALCEAQLRNCQSNMADAQALVERVVEFYDAIDEAATEEHEHASHTIVECTKVFVKTCKMHRDAAATMEEANRLKLANWKQ